MKIISSLSDFNDWRNSLLKPLTIGFVPTMGAIHGGHLSLIVDSQNNADITIVSVFVNPKQFSKNEDFNTYPRMLKDDLKKLNEHNVDVVFTPKFKDIYNEKIGSFNFKDPFSFALEGCSRPDFFPGVFNVVSRLFNIVRPDFAHFGRKDAQQLILIERMVQEGNFSIKIIPGDTVREPSGLAMSSRNQYLSVDEKKSANCLYLSIELSKNLLLNGETNTNKIKAAMAKIVAREKKVVVDYISILDLKTLIEVEGVVRGPVLVSLAVFVGEVRLIDSLFY